MELLFEIDTGDYDSTGVPFVRPSARCVVIRNGKIALVHNLKYDYYKFPGGGIEPNEDAKDALIRETKEETGMIVIPDTLSEFGRVRIKHRSEHPGESYMLQDNFYYFCGVEDVLGETCMDAYEAEQRFTLEYVDAMTAINVNRNCISVPTYHDRMIVEREARVLETLIRRGYIT